MANEKLIAQTAATKLEQLKADAIVSSILERLRQQLPPVYTYHSVRHTHDVMREVLLFAAAAQLNDRQSTLLGVAAAYHDAGFLIRALDNEPLAAQMAVEAMKGCGKFSAEEIQLVSTMILDTQLVATARGLGQQASLDLSKYLLDADLSNFGRADFFEKLELRHQEVGTPRLEFLQETLQFLQGHEWQTTIAAGMREPTKRENIAKLRKMIEQLSA